MYQSEQAIEEPRSRMAADFKVRRYLLMLSISVRIMHG